MIRIPTSSDWIRTSRTLAGVALILWLSVAAGASNLITGAVENKTRNRAAVGDQVILLRLDQGMQEEARTVTDDLGAFTVKVQAPDKAYLVRVIHQGVNYDHQALAGDSLSLEVFDSAPKVGGIAGGIEIIRTGSNGNKLHISDMIEIKNDSSPPITQAGEHTFEVYLPSAARVDSVMAATSGKIGVLIKATAVPGDPGHYTVNFPLRPGSTKFAFNYDLPYGGRAAFHTRVAYPLQQLAVMIPPSMKFASRSPGLELLDTEGKEYQVAAANNVKAGAGPWFEISGAGAQPELQARGRASTNSSATKVPPAPADAAANNSSTQPPKSEAQPIVRSEPPKLTNEWWIIGAIAGLVAAACGFLIWRRGRRVKPMMSSQRPGAENKIKPSGTRSGPLLDALKDQLLEIETARLEGSLSPDEYAAAKKALEGTVKRALARSTAIQ